MKQVEELQKQLLSLRGDVREVRAEIRDGLREGVENDDVRKIQELLATDPTIYPRGLVSGYYGPLTKEAVMAFQKRHNLPETGIVDEATKKLIQDYLNKKTDRVVAPGWFKAPGLDKKIEEKKRVEEKKEEKKEVKKEDKKYEDNVNKDAKATKDHSEGMINAAANVIADLEKYLRNAKAGRVDASDIREAEKELADAKSDLAKARVYYAKGEYQDAYDDAYEAKMSAYDGIEELK
jgi:peptidoglycan hydrolase-like protein with peptidoglycan-binding domain